MYELVCVRVSALGIRLFEGGKVSKNLRGYRTAVTGVAVTRRIVGRAAVRPSLSVPGYAVYQALGPINSEIASGPQ